MANDVNTMRTPADDTKAGIKAGINRAATVCGGGGVRFGRTPNIAGFGARSQFGLRRACEVTADSG